jgi:peptidoglycan hydrolase-like protein with peptidoglycan-binding domain
MSRRRTAVVTSLAAVASLAAAAAALVVHNRTANDPGTHPVNQVTTGTAAVRRVTVAERQVVNGTLGHSGSYDVIASGAGLLTWFPPVATVVRRGQILYEVDGMPVVLMYGGRPSWRAFELGMANGLDVQQLETNLAALGYGSWLTVDHHFSTATYAAIRHWQADAHLPVTGSITLGQVLFLPQEVRISAHDLKLGQPIEPGTTVEHGTSDQPAITIPLPPQQAPTTKAGDSVVVTLPDGTTRPGRITSVGAVASSSASGDTSSSDTSSSDTSSEPTVPVTVRVTGTITGFLDQAQVQIMITVAAHHRVLAVPVTALNPLPGGGYQVVVVDGVTRRRVRVQTGLFDDFAGLAEVSGQGLAAGQLVQVPSD